MSQLSNTNDSEVEGRIEEIDAFFENEILGWMIGDLKRAVGANTNFLTALGCLTYTEAIGWFLPPLPREIGTPEEKHFYRCLFRLQYSQELRAIDDTIRKDTGLQRGLYKHLRHSGAHSYYFQIKKRDENGEMLFHPIGIIKSWTKVPQHSLKPPIGFGKNGALCIATGPYVDALESAVQEFRKRICEQRDPQWVKYGIAGINYIKRGVRG